MSTHNICFPGEVTEALLMSTHNICFYGEIKISFHLLFEKSVIWSYADRPMRRN